MRTGLTLPLVILSAALVAAAQPPAIPPAAGKLIIRPGGKGAVDPRETDPVEKDGFIIIRPNGKVRAAPLATPLS